MQIETERLVLREIEANDWHAMFDYWTDPRYQRYYPVRHDLEQTVRDLTGQFVASQTQQPRRNWQLAVVSKAEGRLIGNCGIRVNDPEQREANIGYELNPRYWGHGYATEAAEAIVAFGFGELNMHRVWAECNADNIGSARVLERLGMRREAHFREHQWFKDRWWDTCIYAVLDHEWQETGRLNI